MKCNCDYCGKEFEKDKGAYNRAKKINSPLYCNKTCTGLARRKNKTIEQQKKEKAEYDREFRRKNKDKLKAIKSEYHKRTYDPIKAAIERKKNMPRHVEYCRQPKYKAYKKQYDEKHRAKKLYGEFAEAAIVLFDLEDELDRKSPEMLSIKFQNKTVNKSQNRKKQWQRQHKIN